MTIANSLYAAIDVGPDDGPVFVLLHGRGSTEQDLLPIGKLLDPRATTVAVRALFPAAPWGYGPGYAWYQFMGGTNPEPESFVASQEALHAFIESLRDRLGRSPRPLILGGFSQGGTMALAYHLRNPGIADAVIVFSGFLATHPSVDANQTGTTPIFWGHGTADSAIAFANAELGREALEKGAANLEFHPYPGMPHSITAEELTDVRTWLKRTIAP